MPYPVGSIEPDAWARLPEARDIAALEQAAAEAYRVRDPACVVAVPGAPALIQLAPALPGARRVGVLGFTYAEHARCFRRAGAEVQTVERLSEADRFDAVVVVNPNNPDGRLLSPDDLLAAAARMAARGGLLIVDESFIDVLGAGASVAPRMPEAGLLVMRSFGKTYGLAGLRLGFALAPRRLAERIRESFGPWAVSGPAVSIGRRALRDEAWLANAAERLGRDARRMDALLRALGLELLGGCPLFRLAACEDAHAMFDQLCRRGVLARPFAQRPRWLRFGLPAPEYASLLEARLGL